MNQNPSSDANTNGEVPDNLNLPKATISIGEHNFEVWVADDNDERMDGLMYFTEEQMADLPDGTHRGMLFLFPVNQSPRHGFWMRNTYIGLDIAFIDSDFEIVTIRTMAPLVDDSYYPEGYWRYALEVNANLFSDLDIKKGDVVTIPDSVLNPPDDES